jgi:hypothetical protein
MPGFPTNHGGKLSPPASVATVSDRLRTEAQIAAIDEPVLRKRGAMMRQSGRRAQPS